MTSTIKMFEKEEVSTHENLYTYVESKKPNSSYKYFIGITILVAIGMCSAGFYFLNQADVNTLPVKSLKAKDYEVSNFVVRGKNNETARFVLSLEKSEKKIKSGSFTVSSKKVKSCNVSFTQSETSIKVNEAECLKKIGEELKISYPNLKYLHSTGHYYFGHNRLKDD